MSVNANEHSKPDVGFSPSGSAIASARKEIALSLSEGRFRETPPSPIELVRTLSAGKSSEPYRVAVTSMIASGQIEATSNWKLRLTKS